MPIESDSPGQLQQPPSGCSELQPPQLVYVYSSMWRTHHSNVVVSSERETILYTGWGPSSLAKLVYNYNNNSVWYLWLYLDGLINQLITRGPHPVFSFHIYVNFYRYPIEYQLMVHSANSIIIWGLWVTLLLKIWRSLRYAVGICWGWTHGQIEASPSQRLTLLTSSSRFPDQTATKYGDFDICHEFVDTIDMLHTLLMDPHGGFKMKLGMAFCLKQHLLQRFDGKK